MYGQGVTNEHFIVWMRTAALPQFRKLYGKIDTDIPAGTTLTFNVDAYFEVTSFGGKKSLGKPGPAPHTCDEGALRVSICRPQPVLSRRRLMPSLYADI